MRLYIGNKNYSSWSMRPWLVLKAFGIPFEEQLIPLFVPGFREMIEAVSGAGKVPVLVDGDTVVWETIAIIDYLADRNPRLSIWPAGLSARAHARSVSAEMHAGFLGVRSACPMNLAKRYAARDRGDAVAVDVARISGLWREARERFGGQSPEPFLYGPFSAADAMFAPVVARFHSYNLTNDPDILTYMAAVRSHPAYREWERAGIAEPWVIDEDEADEPAIEDLRAARS